MLQESWPRTIEAIMKSEGLSKVRWIPFALVSVWGTAVLALGFLCSCGSPRANNVGRKGDFIAAFGGTAVAPEYRNVHITYGLDPKREKYFVHVPNDYVEDRPYGLVVFIDAEEDVNEVPYEWARVLDARHMLFVAPQNGGNDQNNDRRMGLAVMGALQMMKHYRIDPSRVYVAGYSGGARIAGKLGFYQSEVFHGTIQNCGADFHKQVSTLYATSWLSRSGEPYGTFEATDEEIARAKQVRFVLVTGTRDFRRGNILDIFNGGFAKEGFKAKLFDVPGMQHTTCSGEVLSAALDFIESIPSQQQPSALVSFVPDPGQTFSLDLDTATGRYSNWRHDNLGAVSALWANIRIPALRKDAKSRPVFSVWVQKTESGHVLDTAGIQFFTRTQEFPLAIRVVRTEAGKLTLTEPSAKEVKMNEAVTVQILWTTPNMITIKIGESETHNVKIPWSIDSVEIAASTGEMKVDPLIFGSVGH